jgi:hypothetical protein
VRARASGAKKSCRHALMSAAAYIATCLISATADNTNIHTGVMKLHLHTYRGAWLSQAPIGAGRCRKPGISSALRSLQFHNWKYSRTLMQLKQHYHFIAPRHNTLTHTQARKQPYCCAARHCPRESAAPRRPGACMASTYFSSHQQQLVKTAQAMHARGHT